MITIHYNSFDPTHEMSLNERPDVVLKPPSKTLVDVSYYILATAVFSIVIKKIAVLM